MWDVFLAFAYHDEHFALGVAEALGAQGLTLGLPLVLGPGMRFLPQVD